MSPEDNACFARGDLDLYVSTGDAYRLEGQPDVVFANDGQANLRDVSGDSGACFREHRVSRGVAVGDFDNDGDQVLTVAQP